MKDTIYIVLIAIVCFFQPPIICAEDQYIPEPILFVHGFARGNKDNWSAIEKEIEQRKLLDYTKYNVKSELYYVSDYHENLSNGSIAEIGAVVQNDLRQLSNAHNKPVKIVAHSMGGLATRYVYNEAPDLVDSVVFCGVPHLGSPLRVFYGFLMKQQTVRHVEWTG